MNKWTRCDYEDCTALAQDEYCPLHQERQVCKHYRIKERSVSVPWCSKKEVEILGVDGSWYCAHCKDREDITINLPMNFWARQKLKKGE